MVFPAVSLWPVFFARVGLRGITLPLFATLTAYFLWKALQASRLTYYALAGALLGLTIYTYQASRVFPIIFAIFFAYLFLLRRLSTKSSSFTWRSVAVFFITATAVATPLILYLTVINPVAEQRIADLAGPLSKLSNGDPSDVLQSTLNTLGMFTFRGDAVFTNLRVALETACLCANVDMVLYRSASRDGYAVLTQFRPHDCRVARAVCICGAGDG